MDLKGKHLTEGTNEVGRKLRVTPSKLRTAFQRAVFNQLGCYRVPSSGEGRKKNPLRRVGNMEVR